MATFPPGIAGYIARVEERLAEELSHESLEAVLDSFELEVTTTLDITDADIQAAVLTRTRINESVGSQGAAPMGSPATMARLYGVPNRLSRALQARQKAHVSSSITTASAFSADSMAAESAHVALARKYLAALSSGAPLEDFFTPDYMQEEFPNLLNPGGGRSDLATLLARSERGKDMVVSQAYDVVRVYESGACVIVEVKWSATFRIPVRSLMPGSVMRARFAVFLDFEGDRIVRQRNYDCFDAF
eukprot:c47389_g1_i1.p1 GENE.c47389_g1_i1~~c47389_g1_i1.p1  ORF type:complete len:246 (+),score=42.06 c47389_g1_i1:36-773(+)